MWKLYGIAVQTTHDDKTRRMSTRLWISKATDIDSEYVILTAFSWQQWLRERASMLRLYVHYRVIP